jgi:hypothetical protein
MREDLVSTKELSDAEAGVKCRGAGRAERIKKEAASNPGGVPGRAEGQTAGAPSRLRRKLMAGLMR